MAGESRWLGPAWLAVLVVATPATAQDLAHEPAPRWRLGAEEVRWSFGSADGDDVLDFRSVVVSWHPGPGSDVHLKGGLGYLSYRFDTGSGEQTRLSIGPTLGFGYDVRLAEGVALSPFVSWITTPFGNARIRSDARHGETTTSLLRFGLGLTWRH